MTKGTGRTDLPVLFAGRVLLPKRKDLKFSPISYRLSL